jgi:hypothetical protein
MHPAVPDKTDDRTRDRSHGKLSSIKERRMATIVRASRVNVGLFVGLAVAFVAGSAQGEESKGMMQRVEATAKEVGSKIEQGVKKVVKKVEDKHVGDKVEQKLKKAANKTAEGFEKAGKKIKQKLGD